MSQVKRGKIGVPGKSYFIFSRIRGSKEVISMFSSLRRFDKDEVATQRMKIIKFYKTYGEKATKEAFSVDRYCKEKEIKTVSTSTIGNIIKRNNFFFQKEGRIYHNPNSKWAQNKNKRKKEIKS